MPVTPSIRLGRIFGIEVGFNWSLIFIFALYAWTLATTVLPVDAPGYGAWCTGPSPRSAPSSSMSACWHTSSRMPWSHGVTASRSPGSRCGCSAACRSWKVSLRPPAAEALIAGAGPLTSFVVAGIAFGLAAATAGNLLIADLFSWLTFVNLALGLFNLVPAFPWTAGGFLSSFLWWRSGSRRQGVHNAVRVGRVFAYLMIAAGVLELFLGNVASGIWIAFIGWFLLSAAAWRRPAPRSARSSDRCPSPRP